MLVGVLDGGIGTVFVGTGMVTVPVLLGVGGAVLVGGGGKVAVRVGVLLGMGVLLGGVVAVAVGPGPTMRRKVPAV